MENNQPDLGERLKLIEQILGESCRVSDDPAEWEATEKNLEKENCVKEASLEPPKDSALPKVEHADVPEPPTPSLPAAVYNDEEVGTQADWNVIYCSWQTITSYPQHFIGKTNRAKALPFFQKILESTKWDFYYTYDFLKPKEPAHLLVPTAQFEQFLASINAVLDTKLRIPSGPHRKVFFLKFAFDDIVRPRYLLGHRPVKSEDEATASKETNVDAQLPSSPESWPKVIDEDVEKFHASSIASKEAWMSIMKLVKVELNKRKANSEERRRRRRERDLVELQNIGKVMADTDTILIAIDFEAIEVSPHPISEVGISIIDPVELQNTLPGDKGESWWPLIKAHHLRIHEYAGLRNYRHVQGWPENFNFGESVIVPKVAVAEAILNIFEPYTSQKRSVTFVGHDLGQDTRYMYKVGVDIEKLASSIDQVDTQRLHKAWKDLDQPRSLGRVLDDLGLEHQFLHNAGNDAMYTLRAMLAIAVVAGKGKDKEEGEKEGKDSEEREEEGKDSEERENEGKDKAEQEKEGNDVEKS